MTQQAIKTNKQMVIIDPSTFRFPQASDKFKLELTTDARQYVIVNQTKASRYVVTFMVSASNKKLASCTCEDFANIRKHGRQCKHIHVAYNFHVSRCKAKQVAEHVQAEKPATSGTRILGDRFIIDTLNISTSGIKL